MGDFFKSAENMIVLAIVRNEVFLFFAKILFDALGIKIKLM